MLWWRCGSCCWQNHFDWASCSYSNVRRRQRVEGRLESLLKSLQTEPETRRPNHPKDSDTWAHHLHFGCLDLPKWDLPLIEPYVLFDDMIIFYWGLTKENLYISKKKTSQFKGQRFNFIILFFSNVLDDFGNSTDLVPALVDSWSGGWTLTTSFTFRHGAQWLSFEWRKIVSF